jgi:hypothetical protein
MIRSGSLMVESEINNKKHIRKSKLLPKYLEKSKIDEMVRLREVMRPKQLKPTTEFPGYS